MKSAGSNSNNNYSFSFFYRPVSSGIGSASSGGEAGAVSSEAFEAAFASTAPAAVYGVRGLDDLCRHAAALLGDRAADWEKRVDAVSI